eukprot:Gb_22105 [translate_table: standard]
MADENIEGRSLAETPTWSVATVTTVMVAICFVVERSIHHFGKWLAKTKRKPLLAALDKIKEELMLLGLISLLLGQWARWISDICVKSSVFSSRFYPCSKADYDRDETPTNHSSVNRMQIPHGQSDFARGRHLVAINHCHEGHEPFASYESLEQLHRFLFILGVTHVLYCCLTMLLAMIKIYSWRVWEIEAHSKSIDNIPDTTKRIVVINRQSTFVFHHTSHPWSKNKILIWVLCFVRQFVRSVTKADYMALRLGFIMNHRLRLTYDFHSYMLRTMEDEFRDIVGISWPLWGYAILCIFFNLHGLNFYFWISFIPAILILLVGTKLQHVMAKMALENVEVTGPFVGTQLKPRDDLFWFGRPELLLWLIQFISFQNAFEMATFAWSWWEIKAHTCFMKDHGFVYVRLVSGLLIQFWCSYGTLSLYAIVTQMGSRFKKSLVTEEIRESLHGWRKRVKEKSKRDSSHPSVRTAKSSIAPESVAGDKYDIGDESPAVDNLSRSPSMTTKRSTSLQRELSITFQKENSREEVADQIQQEDVLSSHVSVYSFSSSNNPMAIESNRLDDVEYDSTDEDD